MSDLALTKDDVEKVKRAAYMVKDRGESEGIDDPATDEQMDLLIDFCNALIVGDVDSFLRSQDMED